MGRWDLGMLARAAEGKILRGAPQKTVAAVGTDSRRLPPDALFVALRGDRFDGHDYLGQAVTAGASALMVDGSGTAGLAAIDPSATAKVAVVQVKDTLQALGDMAQAVRRIGNRPVVAVTGSNGKTTTKELCAAALASRGAVHRTAGNLNNLIGVPLTLFAWPEDTGTWAAVVEMGMNASGEIDRLTAIAEPDVGVITNIAAAHLEGLGSLAAIAAAKGELFRRMPSSAVAVVNQDDPQVMMLMQDKSGGQIGFGTAETADVRILRVRQEPTGVEVTIDAGGRLLQVRAPLIGEHHGHNIAAALAAADALGVDLAAAADHLARGASAMPGGRLSLLPEQQFSGRRLSILDDSYNANPHSMHAAFVAQRSLQVPGRRVAVIGDMYELGSEEGALHRHVGQDAAGCGVGLVFALGALADEVALGARAGGAEAFAFREFEDLLEALEQRLEEGDHILVKGSRGMRMERVVKVLSGGGSGN